jgi:hypothetical protein
MEKISNPHHNSKMEASGMIPKAKQSKLPRYSCFEDYCILQMAHRRQVTNKAIAFFLHRRKRSLIERLQQLYAISMESQEKLSEYVRNNPNESRCHRFIIRNNEIVDVKKIEFDMETTIDKNLLRFDFLKDIFDKIDPKKFDYYDELTIQEYPLHERDYYLYQINNRVQESQESISNIVEGELNFLRNFNQYGNDKLQEILDELRNQACHSEPNAFAVIELSRKILLNKPILESELFLKIALHEGDFTPQTLLQYMYETLDSPINRPL